MPRTAYEPLTRLLNGCTRSDTGCLLWNGSTSLNGYGKIGVLGQKGWRTHRLAYMLANGSLPEPGYIVGHKCDVRLCCNPDHLEAITHDENMRQMAERKRTAKPGKKHLPYQTKIDIANSKKTIAVLAEEFNIDTRTVERYRARYRQATATETEQ